MQKTTWIVLITFVFCSQPYARADDLDRAQGDRRLVNNEIDILSRAQALPSQSCVAALDEMHTTDEQLKQLNDQVSQGGEASQALQSEQSEASVARDVLATDLQSAASACRPDAIRVCASAASSAVAKLCETFHLTLDAAGSTSR